VGVRVPVNQPVREEAEVWVLRNGQLSPRLCTFRPASIAEATVRSLGSLLTDACPPFFRPHCQHILMSHVLMSYPN
jgi:hypothetical protein